MSAVKSNSYYDATGGSNAVLYGVSMRSGGTAWVNRIINGDMRIDQRNAGASVTPTATAYTLDRWNVLISQSSKFSIQQNAGSVTPPAGFSNYIGVTSLSAFSVAAGDYFTLRQPIEGFNVSDLGWGAAGAQSVTLSFWVRSSLTGTFGGSIVNDGGNRAYPFTYTISSANTWEQKSVTIAGDTTGTWPTTSGRWGNVNFGFGVGSTYSGTAGSWSANNYISATGATSVVGTSGATFYITGVQLEAGSVASPFERRDYGRELIMCQRYYQEITVKTYSYCGGTFSTTDARATIPFVTTMRTEPTGLSTTGTIQFSTNAGVGTGSIAFSSATVSSINVASSSASGLQAAGGTSFLRSSGGPWNIQVSAEL